MEDFAARVPGTEADWRADLRSPLPQWKTGPRVEWLRQHRIEQGDRCHYCGCRFRDRWDDRLLVATLDHVIPKSQGGEHSFENTVAACWLCNTAKQSMMPEEAAVHLPHRRIALLNTIERKAARSKRTIKRQRQRARERIREAACAH